MSCWLGEWVCYWVWVGARIALRNNIFFQSAGVAACQYDSVTNCL